MGAKSGNAAYETIVSEALGRMRDLTTASSSYQVDRFAGQVSVRRAVRTTEQAFPADIVAVLTGADRTSTQD